MRFRICGTKRPRNPRAENARADGRPVDRKDYIRFFDYLALLGGKVCAGFRRKSLMLGMQRKTVLVRVKPVTDYYEKLRVTVDGAR